MKGTLCPYSASRLIGFTLLTLLLMGCNSLLTQNGPPSNHYLLAALPATSVPATLPATPAKTEGTLLVQTTTTGPGLTTDRVMAREGSRVMPIRQMRWAEAAPDLLEKTVTRYLELQGGHAYVTHQRGGPPADQQLLLDLRALYAVSDRGQPTVAEVAVSYRLVDRLQRAPIAAGTLNEEEPIVGQDEAAVLAAFQAAALRLLGRLQQAVETAPTP